MCGRWNVVQLAFFSKRAAFWEPVPKRGAEGDITAADAHSLFFFPSLGLPICLWIWLFDMWTIPSLFCVCHPCQPFSPALGSPSSVLQKQKSGLFDMECTGFGPPMIRADRSRCCTEAEPLRAATPTSDSALGGERSAA